MFAGFFVFRELSTVMLVKDNVIKYYEGMPGFNAVIKETSLLVTASGISLYKKEQQ